jgi:Zn-dependent M28 family amino/carboxypeptidase
MSFRLGAAAFLIAAAGFAQQRAPGNETISKEQLSADLHFLAGDSMRGRLTGTAEYRLSAEYIESRFARLGLKPVSGEALFHRYDLILSRLDQPNRLVIEQGQAGSRTARLLEDFYPLIFSADARAASPVAFLGYGVHAPDLDWDDYKGRNLGGTIALVLDGDPGANDPKSRFDGLVTSEYANPLRKALWAQDHGASAVLFVNAGSGDSKVIDSFPGNARAYWPAKPPHLKKYTLAAYVNRIRIPVAQVSPAIAASLIRYSGRTLLQAAVESEKGPGSGFLAGNGQRVEIETALKRTSVQDRSVVAKIEGADPKLSAEAVIVSAHYDHNGADGDQIYNGADDNGSGAVALIEIAEAYALAAAQGNRPRRTVIFASWGSEERCCGPLLGAWAWVEDPPWPLDRTVATLNMDMIGRSEEVPERGGGRRFAGLAPQTAASNANNVNILGWSYSPELSKLADEANHSTDLRLLRRYDNNRSQLLRRSDQWPFLQRAVPALFFHTGLHPDYHTTNDRPERIDYAKMERIARLIHQLSWNLANRDGARPAMPKRREIPDAK